MGIYFVGVLISLLSFIYQIWPRLKRKYFGVDPWRHLLVAEYIRKHKCLPESLTEKYITSAPFGYPPVMSLYLALFPKKFADKYNFIFAPIFDAIHNYLIFITTFLLTNNLLAATFAQVIAVLTPVIVLESSVLSPRILSYLLFSASFFSLLLFSINGEYLWLILAGILLFILFYEHRFGIQAYFFSMVAFSIVEHSPRYVIFFLIIFGLVILLGGKKYRLIFTEHMGSLVYWYKNGNLRFGHQFRHTKEDPKSVEFVRKLFLFSSKLPFVSIVGESPWLLIFLAILCIKSFNLISVSSVLPSTILDKLILWVIALSVVSLLVLSIKKLRFIGEGYRYIEYVIFPLAIILGSYVPFLFSRYKDLLISLSVFTFICLFFGIIFLQKKLILNDRNRTITKEKWEIINYLNSNVGDSLRLAVFPQQEGDAILYFAKGKVLTADSLINLAQIDDFYPAIKKPMVDIIKKYKLNHIFFDKRYVSFEELDLRKYKVIKDINDFVLVKV